MVGFFFFGIVVRLVTVNVGERSVGLFVGYWIRRIFWVGCFFYFIVGCVVVVNE